MKVDLDALEAFDAVVRHGSFAAAARSLHKAQSAVSYAVRRLEERLGVELFDRSGHRATLTDAGQTILEEGRVVLASARRLEGLASQLDRGWEPRLEVIIDGILPMGPIMRALQDLAGPKIPTHVQVKMEYLGGVQHRFEVDRADMMVVKDFQPGEQYSVHPLGEVEVILLASPAHPLGQLDGDVALDLPDLQQHVELTIQDSSARAIDPHMFGSARVYFLSDFHTKRQALLEGLGYGWMPRHLVEEELQAGRLREVSYGPGSRYEFTPSLVHRADRPLGRAGRQFFESLQAGFAARRW